ncbi:MAG: formyltransferase family protein [Bacteroidia bacterium]
MKIVLLCGSQANQRALASKISKDHELAGIVIEKKTMKRKWTISFVLKKIADRLFFADILSSWKNMLLHYEKQFPDFPVTKKLITENINSKESVAFIREAQPDLVMVSGTRLVREEILRLAVPRGIINLHTGLSPYVKGGPNCTNWCIADDMIHLIGNTVMWIDSGIDSGNIITTEAVSFDGTEDLSGIHLKVMEHAHSLYLAAVQKILHDPQNCPSVKQQDIAPGRLYKNKEWNQAAKSRLRSNMKKFGKTISSAAYREKQKELKLIPLR